MRGQVSVDVQELVAQSPVLIAALAGPAHVFTFANPSYERAAGRRGRALIGRPARDVFPEVEGQRPVAVLDHVYTTGTPFTGYEIPVRYDRNGDGQLEEAYFSITFQPLRGAGGAIEGVLLTGIEVTGSVLARQRAEGERARLLAEAQAARDRLQHVLDVLPEAVAMTEARGQIVLVNAVARELLGAESVGRSLVRLEREASAADGISRIDGTPYPAGELPLERSLWRGEDVRGVQLQLPHPGEGRMVPVLMNSVPLRDAAGAIDGALVVFQDITTIKNFERARDDLLATVTHDLKNPLTAIQGLAELTQQQAQRAGTPSNERIAARQESIVTAATQMTALLNELLDVMQLEMGQPLTLERRPTDLVALVQRVVDHQREIAEHPIRVDVDVATLVCDVDAERIERVVGNLIANAIKYSPQGADVTVHLAQTRGGAGTWTVLTVADRGRGIPAPNLPHVFDRFYRAENVGQTQGTGIGLASVREIVEQHGGTVAIASAEGTGTVVTVRLPSDGGAVS